MLVGSRLLCIIILQFSFHGCSCLFLKLLKLHCQPHVALHLQLALEERLLRVQLSRHQVDQVTVRNGQRDIGFG